MFTPVYFSKDVYDFNSFLMLDNIFRIKEKKIFKQFIQLWYASIHFKLTMWFKISFRKVYFRNIKSKDNKRKKEKSRPMCLFSSIQITEDPCQNLVRVMAGLPDGNKLLIEPMFIAFHSSPLPEFRRVELQGALNFDWSNLHRLIIRNAQEL